MYSQCPECLTRFRVSAVALRAAHGTVRCGRCGSAFDALPRLSDTLQDDDPATALVEPVSPGVAGSDDMAGATAVGLLSTDVGDGVPEFHFSADDIEQVFVDARDWQSRFGAASSPGDRAGLLGDTGSAELVGFLKDGETGEEDPPGGDASDPPVWVHEPESVEDITLEGERIQIEGIGGFDRHEEDLLEREIEKEIEEQHRAEITVSHRRVDGDEAAIVPTVEAVDAGRAPDDDDSTGRFRVLRDTAESVHSETPVAESAELITPLETRRVVGAATSTATAIAVEPPIAAVQPTVVPMAARWRRPPEPATDDSLDIGDHDHPFIDDLDAAPGARGSPWIWGVAALVLALLLAVQLTHHYRLQLARNAAVGPTLRDVYSGLGLPLPPNWNLPAFELRQWGANESAPSSAGTMTVRASLKNGAAFAQPMPLLRLELEDRFGGTVARRDFQPAEYLKDPAQATRLLPAGASTEAELALVGATSEAVGYRLDVCLRDENGVIRCAGAAGTARTSSQAPE